MRKIIVAEWAEKWLKIATAGKGNSQQQSIRNAIKNHILPIIGEKPLLEVQHSDVALVMAALADRSYSLKNKVLVHMRAMFEAARRDHLITENPCDGLKAGKRKYKEKQALTEEQQRRLESAVAGTRAELFVLIGLYTGLRREEILALQWDCVCLSAPVPYLTVRRALRWEHNRPFVNEILKSDAAKRSIPLPKTLLSKLIEQQQEYGYVIGGDYPLSESQFNNLWDQVKRRTASTPAELGTKARNSNVVRSLDFRVSPHQLRHTYITRLVMSGANLKHVQHLAGHSDMRMTLQVYTHIVLDNPSVFSNDVYTAFPGEV